MLAWDELQSSMEIMTVFDKTKAKRAGAANPKWTLTNPFFPLLRASHDSTMLAPPQDSNTMQGTEHVQFFNFPHHVPQCFFFSSDCFADPSLGTRGVVVAANGVMAAWANVEGQPAVRPAAMLRWRMVEP